MGYSVGFLCVNYECLGGLVIFFDTTSEEEAGGLGSDSMHSWSVEGRLTTAQRRAWRGSIPDTCVLDGSLTDGHAADLREKQGQVDRISKSNDLFLEPHGGLWTAHTAQTALMRYGHWYGLKLSMHMTARAALLPRVLPD